MSKILEIRRCLRCQINRGDGGRSQSAQGRQSFLYFGGRGWGGHSVYMLWIQSPQTLLCSLSEKGGRGELGWGRGRASPWQMKHGTQLAEAWKVVKRKEKGGDGWREDERASPCQMKHRTQLSPAAGSDTSYVLLPLAVHAPGAPNALCLFCSEWQKMPKIQYWGQTYQDCSWKYMVIFFNCPLKS